MVIKVPGTVVGDASEETVDSYSPDVVWELSGDTVGSDRTDMVVKPPRTVVGKLSEKTVDSD